MATKGLTPQMEAILNRLGGKEKASKLFDEKLPATRTEQVGTDERTIVAMLALTMEAYPHLVYSERRSHDEENVRWVATAKGAGPAQTAKGYLSGTISFERLEPVSPDLLTEDHYALADVIRAEWATAQKAKVGATA